MVFRTLILNREILLKKQQADLARLQADLVMNRLKPHFIYNALNTIYALCDSSAEETKNAISMFAGYLRASLVDIDAHRLVPFEEELRRVKDYLAIEKLRFGEKIDIEYDIREVDFLIPPLALMTIAENAVNYAVERKPDGGRIVITSDRNGNGYTVTVSDTGDGFDTSNPEDTGFADNIYNQTYFETFQNLDDKTPGLSAHMRYAVTFTPVDSAYLDENDEKQNELIKTLIYSDFKSTDILSGIPYAPNPNFDTLISLLWLPIVCKYSVTYR